LKMQKLAQLEIQQRVTTLLEQVNLSEFGQRKVTELSGGEQQRVALARALAPKPRLLMFDEPLGALDRSLKEDLLNELRAILRKAKIPAIYVTHDQDEAFGIADRILLLHEGQIVREGSPEEVWSNPGSAWAAGFLGVGQVIQGVVISVNKVKTDFGVFNVDCKLGKGEIVSLLVKQSSRGGEELRLKVEDVLFDRDQYQVRVRGGLVFLMREKPRIGQMIRLRVKVECLK